MTAPNPRSPSITDCSWGSVSVDGHSVLRDAKLYPGGARAWDWRETGTHHEPGIQPTDVAELLNHGATSVVLSTGVYQRLRVCPETILLLKDKGVSCHVLPTPDAVTLYNNLIETEPVGALIHSTC